MKLVFCLECGDLFSPGTDAPKTCGCGYSLAKWHNPKQGWLHVASRAGRYHLRVIGMNNSWIWGAAQAPSFHSSMGDLDEDIDAMHREIAQKTCQEAEGYLFHTSRRNCPVIMVDVMEDRRDIYYKEELLKEVPWAGKVAKS